MVLAPAWLGALLKSGRANAATLWTPDIQALLAANSVQRADGRLGRIPFICFDLAGGANLVGSEVLVGGRAARRTSCPPPATASSACRATWCRAPAAFISSALGLLWHSDGAHPARHHCQGHHAGHGGGHQRRGDLRDVAERHRQQSAQPDVRHRDGGQRAGPDSQGHAAHPGRHPVERLRRQLAAPMQLIDPRCSRPRSPSRRMTPAWSTPAARRSTRLRWRCWSRRRASAAARTTLHVGGSASTLSRARCPRPRAPTPASSSSAIRQRTPP